MLYEFRDYTYRRDKWDAYVPWAREAAAILDSRFDIVGFWAEAGDEPALAGPVNFDPSNGPPNLSWIIRWESAAAREAGWEALLSDLEWQETWARHPDATGYLHMSVRLMEEFVF